MRWREQIIGAALKRDEYRNMLRGGSSDRRAIGYAVRCMAEDAADDLAREREADCDPVALADAQARLSLLTAFLAFDSELVPGMTSEEFVEVFNHHRHSAAARFHLVREGIARGLITEAQSKKLLDAL